MTSKKPTPTPDTELRRRAEERMERRSGRSDLDHLEQEQLINELEVHRTELALQNEELRETANRLEESTRRYKELFDFGPVGYLRLSSDGSIQESNLAAGVILEKSREHLEGERLDHFVDLDHRDDLRKLLDRTRETSDPQKVEVRLKGDYRRWVQIHTVLLPDWEESGVLLATFMDIDSRKRAEAEVEQERAAFKRLVENTPDIILRLDFKGRLVYANPALTRLTGLQVKDVTGELPTRFPGMSGESARNWAQALARARETGLPAVFEFKLPDQSNGPRQYHVQLVPETDNAGNLTSFLAIARDMTPLLNLSGALRREKERAENASRTKSEFLANMSHEIRTPLNAIHGMLQLLRRTDLDERQEERVDMAKTSADNLLEIINDILDFSKIEAGMMELRPKDFHLPDFLETVVDEHRHPARQRGLGLELDLDPDLPERVRSDPSRIRQVLANLLSNAVKFTEQGTVTLSARLDSAPPLKPGEVFSAEIAVTDTGIGMTPDMVTDIFEPFVQGEPGTTKRYQGTGLGLSISRRLAGLLGGDLDLESSPGQGTTATLRLQLTLARPGGRESPSQAPPRPSTASLSVLLVEDDTVNQLFMMDLLQEMGHAPVLAATGREALDKLTQDGFDVVLMDIQMPGMDGAEATRRIRAGEAGQGHADVPIIGLSAYAIREEVERYKAAGLNAYLTKPVDQEELQETLMTYAFP